MKETSAVSLPSIVAKALPIDENNKPAMRHEKKSRDVPKNQPIKSAYDQLFHEAMKKKMKESWLNTSLQRAIWNARRRLMTGQNMEDLPNEERDIASGFLSPKIKPDYSKWKHPRHKLPPLNGIVTENSNKVLDMELKGFNPERPVAIRAHGQICEKEFVDPDLQVYPIEFFSLSDRLTLHEPPWLRALRDASETQTYEHFGLCFGCFHKRGPHYHYHVPIRTGGGFTIYRKTPIEPAINIGGLHSLNLNWDEDGLHTSLKSTPRNEFGMLFWSDNFTTELYHIFLDNGGDANALKEYLESNFNSEVLNELGALGVNIKLIEDYADILLRHVRETLTKNLLEQKAILKEKDEDLQYLKSFVQIVSAGGDLEILLCMLEQGRQCESVTTFEKIGGNIELLDHFCAGVMQDFVVGHDQEYYAGMQLTADQQIKKSKIIERLRRYIENENDHRRASSLLEFMTKGGRLDILVEYADKGTEGLNHRGLTEDEMTLIQEYGENFPEKELLLKDIERFVKSHFRSYSSAQLLQKYMENGGKIKVLKQYVSDGCSFASENVQNFIEGGGNIRILQDIGQEFMADNGLKEDLQNFPDDSIVLEAYIRGGGNLPKLIQAIVELTGDPLIGKYVRKRTNLTMNDLQLTKSTGLKTFLTDGQNSDRGTRLHSSSYPPPNSPQGPERSDSIPFQYSNEATNSSKALQGSMKSLLPQLIETARAEMTYDKLLAAESTCEKNEGRFLAKTIEVSQGMHARASGPYGRKRHPAFRLFRRQSSSVSPITGKKRERLWKPPKPFMLKRNEFQSTTASSPFTENRSYELPSLSEDHIVNMERRQRHELNVLRRNYKSKDFKDNWKVAITSPQGSVISEHDPRTPKDFERTNPVTLKRPGTSEKPKQMSRREKQRAKMKAAKKTTNRKPGRERSSSLLSLPSSASLEPKSTMVMRQNSLDYEEDQDDPGALKKKKSKPTKLTNSKATRRRGRIGKITADPTLDEHLDRMEEDEQKNHSDLYTPGHTSENQQKVFDEGTPADLSSSSEDENVKRIEKNKVEEYVVPPLPIITDSDDDELQTQTAFGRTSAPQTPRPRIPIFPEMIKDPKTQVSEDDKWKRSRIDRSQRVNRKAMRHRPLVANREVDIEEEEQSDEEAEDMEDEIEDVLKKYCIIKPNRLPRYRHIFDKHIMLREMRIHERAAKMKRAFDSNGGTNTHSDMADRSYGHAYEQFKKQAFLCENLEKKIEEVELEKAAAKGNLEFSRALTARELLFTNKRLMNELRKSERMRARNRSHQKEHDFKQIGDVMEFAETKMGLLSTDVAYDYDESARVGFESEKQQQPLITSQEPTPQKQGSTPGQPEIPLQDMDDHEIMSKLDVKTKKRINLDPVVTANAATLSSLLEKLERLKYRYEKEKGILEQRRIAAESEKEAHEIERSKRQNFVRQQSVMFQALHPLEDPILDIVDVPEALRDVNGELSRADSAVILEALDFPRVGKGVNFRVFCILAALSESVVSIQPLVKRLIRKKDARALNVKMEKCKEIYGYLLGPTLDNLQAELRSSGHSSAQHYQMVKKLTRDNGGLTFLDFVTYVPLFLDIHQRILTNPLAA